MKARNQPLHFCIIDFTKESDMVQHDQLWLTIREAGFPPHLIQLYCNLYRLLGQPILCQQGSVLKKESGKEATSHHACSTSWQNRWWGKQWLRLGMRSISNPDIILSTMSPDEVQELVSWLERATQEYDLLINTTETKVMTNTDKVLGIIVTGRKLEEGIALCKG